MTHFHLLHTFVQLSKSGTSKFLKISHRASSLKQLLQALISVVLATKLLTTLPTRIEMQKAKNSTTTEHRKQFFELHRKELKVVESKCSLWRPLISFSTKKMMEYFFCCYSIYLFSKCSIILSSNIGRTISSSLCRAVMTRFVEC